MKKSLVIFIVSSLFFAGCRTTCQTAYSENWNRKQQCMVAVKQQYQEDYRWERKKERERKNWEQAQKRYKRAKVRYESVEEGYEEYEDQRDKKRYSKYF